MTVERTVALTENQAERFAAIFSGRRAMQDLLAQMIYECAKLSAKDIDPAAESYIACNRGAQKGGRTMRGISAIAIGLVLLAAVGCKSMAAFTPEQISSLKGVGDALNDIARDANVTAYAEIDLEPLEAAFKQSIELRGMRARVFLFANPAAGQVP